MLLYLNKSKPKKYHFRLFFLQCKEAFPPAHSSASSFYQIAANFMESLLLLGGPFIGAKNSRCQNGNKVVSQAQKHNKTGNTRQNRWIQIVDSQKHRRNHTHDGRWKPGSFPSEDFICHQHHFSPFLQLLFQTCSLCSQQIGAAIISFRHSSRRAVSASTGRHQIKPSADSLAAPLARPNIVSVPFSLFYFGATINITYAFSSYLLFVLMTFSIVSIILPFSPYF